MSKIWLLNNGVVIEIIFKDIKDPKIKPDYAFDTIWLFEWILESKLIISLTVKFFHLLSLAVFSPESNLVVMSMENSLVIVISQYPGYH